MSSFTVVLPVKNGEATIRTAVVSTLRALPTDARLLVRDDGSNDRTVQVLKKISDRRLEIVLGDSVGLARSMNLLMEQVQTELFARMDADDVSLPNRFLREQRAVAEGADFVFAPVVNWKSRTPLLKPQSPRSMSAAASPFHLLVENPFMVPTLLARTSAYRELGGSREVPSEDYELWLRAASAGYRLVRMAVPTLVYRRHASQVSAQKSWLAARARTTIVEDSFNLLAARTIGFVPSWFAWRRDGFRAGEAPDRVIVDLDAMLKSTTELRVDERRPLERRIRFMRRRALARS